MALDEVLRDSLINLRPGVLDNEAQVKLTVIQPVLNELGWRATNPAEFKSEFPVDNRWVDYALGTGLAAATPHPLVFVEAKGVGRADAKGEEQLFSYAVNRGIPLLVLTDGKVWNFYLSMAPGNPPDRRFYRIELTQEAMIPDYAELFRRYLQRDNVVSGRARLDAEEQLRSAKESELARNQIAPCWNALLSEPSPILRDALVEAVERQCGIKPELDDVQKFLQGLHHAPAPLPHNPVPDKPVAPRQPSRNMKVTGKIVGYILDGRRVDTQSGSHALRSILMEFERRDASFLERFAAETRTASRNLVARSRDDLFVTSPHLRNRRSLLLDNGWWLAANLSLSQVKGHIETACRLAGVRFGVQLTLIERQDSRAV